jgi:hypothetical protein
MSAPTLTDLRADLRLVVDARARKLAVYPNPSGEVVLMIVDGSQTYFAEVDVANVPALCAALKRAGTEADGMLQVLGAQYETYVAIERAKGAAT